MRLSPSDPVFKNWPSASGAGVHTDEASSALPDMADMQPELSPADFRALEKASPTAAAQIAVQDGPQKNPGEYSEIIAPWSELIRIAFLTTGVWGPDAQHNVRMITAKDAGVPRRYLPIARGTANPASVRRQEAFWDRMRLLEIELTGLRDRIVARYARTKKERLAGAQAKAAKRGVTLKAPPKEPWVKEIDTKLLPAVRFVLAQEHSGSLTVFAKNKLPFGFKWGVLAKGNAKLSFVAYSELPMATCPGAGQCRVDLEAYDPQPHGAKGWCYSFRAFRTATAYSRMFLNTLANYADREGAIIAGSPHNAPGGDEHNPAVYRARVHAGVAGIRSRSWPEYVKNIALEMTQAKRANGARVYMRLFVDGDMGHEDSILAWMEAIRGVGASGHDIRAGEGYLDVYGYTKCWQQFVNVDRMIGAYGGWPTNYVVNMSSGSVYASGKYQAIRSAMEALPIVRGYFEAVNLKAFVPMLREQAALLKADPNRPIPMPKERAPAVDGLNFNPDRIRDFLMLQQITTPSQLVARFRDVDVDMLRKKGIKEPTQLFRYALEKYLDQLSWDPAFGALVRRELKKDAGEKDYLSRYEQRQRERLDRMLLTGKRGKDAFNDTTLHKKTLALVLQETMWSYGLGGSCPLVCGNCSDHPDDPDLGVHRCASKTTMQHKTISIGLH